MPEIAGSKLAYHEKPDWLPRSPSVSSVHREVYHYTTIENFMNIYASQELWAFEYQSMNDHQETVIANDLIFNILQEKILKRFRDWYKTRLSFRKYTQKHYGTLVNGAKIESKKLTETLHNVTFGGKDKSKTGFSIPFLISFCTHDEDSEYIKKNGLLSQWRAYGGSAGVAVIFDSSRIEDMMAFENENYIYHTFGIGSCVYSCSQEEIDTEFGPLFDRITDLFMEMYDGEEPNFGEIFGPFCVAACRLKHEAFQEEREVRIYGSPASPSDIARSKDEPMVSGKSAKLIHSLNDGRKYIRLFSDRKAAHLPIKRVIVGPSLDQADAYETVLKTVKSTVAVTRSETPLVQRR